MNNNLVPKFIFMLLFIIYIIVRFILLKDEKNKKNISYSLDSVDYDMSKHIYYDENNDYNYIDAEIIDYFPNTDKFKIKFTENNQLKEIIVNRDQIKQLSGEEYIYYPIKSSNITNKLTSLYLSVISFLICMIFIIYSIYNENIFSQILNNNANISYLLKNYIHEYILVFIQIILLGTLICGIHFYKNRIDNLTYFDENWHYFNITLILLNIYLFILYNIPSNKFPTFSLIHSSVDKMNANIANLLLFLVFLIFIFDIIKNKLFNHAFLGYYLYETAFFILGTIICLGLDKKYLPLTSIQILLTGIFMIYNIIYSKSLKFDILYCLLGFNFPSIFTYLLNYKKYKYYHIISIIFTILLVCFTINIYKNMIYHITDG